MKNPPRIGASTTPGAKKRCHARDSDLPEASNSRTLPPELLKMSFVGTLAMKGLARRSAVTMAAARQQGTRRSVVTVPRMGTEKEMEMEAVAQIRARIAYQKEIMAAEVHVHKSHSEEWTELWTWIKISLFVCGPVVVFGVTKDLLFEVHHHRPEGALPEYMGIRKKEFPWNECENCDYFHLECWKQCRAENAAKAAA